MQIISNGLMYFPQSLSIEHRNPRLLLSHFVVIDVVLARGGNRSVRLPWSHIPGDSLRKDLRNLARWQEVRRVKVFGGRPRETWPFFFFHILERPWGRKGRPWRTRRRAEGWRPGRSCGLIIAFVRGCRRGRACSLVGDLRRRSSIVFDGSQDSFLVVARRNGVVVRVGVAHSSSCLLLQ